MTKITETTDDEAEAVINLSLSIIDYMKTRGDPTIAFAAILVAAVYMGRELGLQPPSIRVSLESAILVALDDELEIYRKEKTRGR